jgi:mycothiol synthase
MVSVTRAEGRRDLELVVEVVRRVSGGDVPSIADLEHWGASHPRALLLVARLGGDDAGSGWAGPSAEAGWAQAMIRVLPERRRRGVGGALLQALREHARGLGARELEGRLQEGDGEALRFFERRGFTVVDRRHEMVLCLERWSGSVAEPEGIELTTLDRRPDLVRAVYDLEGAASRDIPTTAVVAARDFGEWHADMLEGPGARPDGWFLALRGDELVGFAGVIGRDGEPGSADHTMTAVRADLRRRGIAVALKRRQIAWARDAGYRTLYAHNHSSNAGMLEINRRLGYRPGETELLIRGPVG